MAQADPKLVEYIKQLLAQGTSEEVVRQSLVMNGWQDEVVAISLEVAKIGAVAPTPVPLSPLPVSPPIQTGPIAQSAPAVETPKKLLRIPVYSALLTLILASSLFVLTDKVVRDLSRQFSPAPEYNGGDIIKKGEECAQMAAQENITQNDLQARHWRCMQEERLITYDLPDYQTQITLKNQECNAIKDSINKAWTGSEICYRERDIMQQKASAAYRKIDEGARSVRLFVRGALVMVFWALSLGLYQLFRNRRRRYLVLSGPYYLVSVVLFLQLLSDIFRYLLDEAAGWGIYAVLVLGVALLTGVVFGVQKYKSKLN